MCTVPRIIRSGALTTTLAALGLAVLAASALAADPKGTLRVAAKADMTTLDPANAIDYQSWIVVEQMFNGLYNCSGCSDACSSARPRGAIWKGPESVRRGAR